MISDACCVNLSTSGFFDRTPLFLPSGLGWARRLNVPSLSGRCACCTPFCFASSPIHHTPAELYFSDRSHGRKPVPSALEGTRTITRSVAGIAQEIKLSGFSMPRYSPANTTMSRAVSVPPWDMCYSVGNTNWHTMASTRTAPGTSF